ncbi:MAG: hypothetical protein WCA08_02385 [Desulfoferrobacter sp.]
MNRFCNRRHYPRLPLAVSACEEREERDLPKVSSEGLKGEAKEAIGTVVEYSKQNRNELVNEAQKDLGELYNGQ